MAKLIMVIDTKRCTGCHTCAMACKLENNLPNNVWWNQVFSGTIDDFTGDRSTFTEGHLRPNANLKVDVAAGEFGHSGGIVNSPTERRVSMNFWTKACQHCEDPVCVKICPYGALYKDPNTGVVDTYFDKCVGCNMCIRECPYDVRHHNNEEDYYLSNVGGQGVNKHETGKVDKCTFCSHRLPQGEQPFCVSQCPHKARYFGDYNDPSSTVSRLLRTRKHKRLLESAGTGPSVYYLMD